MNDPVDWKDAAKTLSNAYRRYVEIAQPHLNRLHDEGQLSDEEWAKIDDITMDVVDMIERIIENVIGGIVEGITSSLKPPR